MTCEYPSPCWFAINVQNEPTFSEPVINQGNIVLDDIETDIQKKFRQMKEREDILIELIENAPPPPKFLSKTVQGQIYEALTEAPEVFVIAANIAFNNRLLLQLYS